MKLEIIVYAYIKYQKRSVYIKKMAWGLLLLYSTLAAVI